MLSNSPNLEVSCCQISLLILIVDNNTPQKLSIKLNHRECIMSPIFNRCRWPKLRALSLLIYSDGRLHSKAFTTFLDAHHAIEDLEWEYLPPENLSPGSLPRLRNLRGRDDTSAIVKILTDKPRDSPRQIESLGLIPLNAQFLQILQSIDATKLRKLELRFFESLVFIRKIADMFTFLTWLQVPSVNYIQAYKTATHHRVQTVRYHIRSSGVFEAAKTKFGNMLQDEWINILRFFRNLEVFHGVSFFSDPSTEPPNGNDEMAQYLVKTNPKLRRVDHWDTMSNKVVVLIREYAHDTAEADGNPVPGAVRWKEVVPGYIGEF
jgi:hypothetical protein